MTEGEVKPCPFCGKPGEVYHHAEIDTIWIAGCAVENCPGEMAAYDYVSRETALAAWNTRAPIPAPTGWEYVCQPISERWPT
jgi:hypothetical protein